MFTARGKEYALRIVTNYVKKEQLESVLKLQDNPWFSGALPKGMKWYSRTAESLRAEQAYLATLIWTPLRWNLLSTLRLLKCSLIQI